MSFSIIQDTLYLARSYSCRELEDVNALLRTQSEEISYCSELECHMGDSSYNPWSNLQLENH
jgi:hypothetical protein